MPNNSTSATSFAIGQLTPQISNLIDEEYIQPGGVNLAPVWSSFASSKKRGAKSMSDITQLLSPISSVLNVKSLTDSKAESVIGIEIENEFKVEPLEWPKADLFRREDDHSLRYYGFEYVSKPLAYDQYKKRLRNLCGRLNATGIPPTNSIRTSIHVHFDVTKLNFIEVLTFACTYWILEGFLSSFAGSHRVGNLFCLRMKDASAIQNYIYNVILSCNLTNSSLLGNELRYGSVNFAALAKFGTLEFRLMRGTTDADTIELWVDTLEAIRQFSLRFANPKELQTFFLDAIDAKDFPKAVLGQDLFNKLRTFAPSDYEEVIRDSFNETQDIFYMHSYDFKKQLEELAELEAKLAKEAEERAKRNYTWTQNVPVNSSWTEELMDINSTDTSSVGVVQNLYVCEPLGEDV